MAEIVLTKSPGGALVPVDQAGADYIAKMKTGAGVKVTITRHNNVQFHRKVFALANYAFDCWEPGEREYKGQKIEKNFDQFRDDITILAGFYTTVFRLDGTFRHIPDSWSFARMDDEKKERMYSGIINAVLKHVLRNTTRADLDTVVENLLRFA